MILKGDVKSRIGEIVQKYCKGKTNHKKASDEIQKILPDGVKLDLLVKNTIKLKSKNSTSFIEFPYKEPKAKKEPTCPICGEPYIEGYFYSTCTNKKCKNYSSFAMQRCGICGSPRYQCAC